MDALRPLSTEALHRRNRILCRTSNYCACLTIFLSASVTIAWISHINAINHFYPAIMEMRVNAAVGFFADGIALIMLVTGRARAAAAVAAISLVIGSVTLIEY